jgi:hypothetical protein
MQIPMPWLHWDLLNKLTSGRVTPSRPSTTRHSFHMHQSTPEHPEILLVAQTGLRQEGPLAGQSGTRSTQLTHPSHVPNANIRPPGSANSSEIGVPQLPKAALGDPLRRQKSCCALLLPNMDDSIAATS